MDFDEIDALFDELPEPSIEAHGGDAETDHRLTDEAWLDNWSAGVSGAISRGNGRSGSGELFHTVIFRKNTADYMATNTIHEQLKKAFRNQELWYCIGFHRQLTANDQPEHWHIVHECNTPVTRSRPDKKGRYPKYCHCWTIRGTKAKIGLVSKSFGLGRRAGRYFRNLV